MRELLRNEARFFGVAGVVALAMRLFFQFRFATSVDDSHFYANIAENWLQHGVYGVTNSGVVVPTLSRLPGYPAFLAAIFALLGKENFGAVIHVQMVFDLATCFLIADIARRLFSDRAAKVAFILAAVCPFLADYAATVLTETLEIFFTALAFDLAFRGLGIGEEARNDRWGIWLGCGFSIGAAILLRPDGGILLAGIGGYLLWLLLRSFRHTSAYTPRSIFLAGVLVGTGAIATLIPWTLRNLHTFHRFEPLAPRYANDADETPMPGFNRWTRTWMAEYVSVQEIYWNVPGSQIDVTRLPNRAFDSQEQHAQTVALFDDYNTNSNMTPELDARFAALAADRVRAAPLRYYVWLPFLRIFDMWMRPRVELMPSDPRWWEFNDDRKWLAVSLAFGAINLIYVVLAKIGTLRGWSAFGLWMLLGFVLLRSVFLGTLENPEPRYTLECYPAIIVLAAQAFVKWRK